MSKESECQRRWYQKNKDKVKAYNKANRVKINRQARDRAYKYKVIVLSHYSLLDYPICARCGQNDIDVLCLDHIEGGGNKQRQSFSHFRGSNLRTWLKKHNYPEGYQVLCANCNLRKLIAERK